VADLGSNVLAPFTTTCGGCSRFYDFFIAGVDVDMTVTVTQAINATSRVRLRFGDGSAGTSAFSDYVTFSGTRTLSLSTIIDNPNVPQPFAAGIDYTTSALGITVRGTLDLEPVAAPSEIPLPPAIYLFGSVLGGAFWLGRRKRSAVSALGSA
jgi:hypothetical protein